VIIYAFCFSLLKCFKYRIKNIYSDNMNKKDINLEEDENNFEIMFSDLTPEAQKKLLKAFHIRSPETMNWDVVPIAIIPLSEN